MPDFTLMRQNMVKSQVMPEEVTNPQVIDALLQVPRELFVPRQLARIAYMDANFPLKKGRVLLRPASLARLLEAVNPAPSDKILYIAGGTGYGPALLGKMGVYVVALDCDENLTQEAERILHGLNLSTVEVVLGPLEEGWKKEAPYDAIIIEGCIDFIPKALASQVKDKGEILTLRYRKARGYDAIKYLKNKETLTATSLFDAFAPRLETFQKPKGFVF